MDYRRHAALLVLYRCIFKVLNWFLLEESWFPTGLWLPSQLQQEDRGSWAGGPRRWWLLEKSAPAPGHEGACGDSRARVRAASQEAPVRPPASSLPSDGGKVWRGNARWLPEDWFSPLPSLLSVKVKACPPKKCRKQNVRRGSGSPGALPRVGLGTEPSRAFPECAVEAVAPCRFSGLKQGLSSSCKEPQGVRPQP